MTPLININHLSKHFGAAAAVDDVSLRVYDGEFLALLGPSGCGKTTLLRMLGGFEQPDSGEVHIDGKDMRGLPPNKRPVNMVFQSYAIFPHLTARENIAYGLRVVRTPKAETGRRVDEALALVRMEAFAEQHPDKLSGGQRQRIALARALVKKPKVLLLDEPLSALDAKLRDLMRAELVNLQQTVGITFIIVTHDQDEALSMAGRIAVMRDGKICQTAAPQELYESPANKFVADFIGRMNILPAKKHSDDNYEIAGLGTYPIPPTNTTAAPNTTAAQNAAIHPAQSAKDSGMQNAAINTAQNATGGGGNNAAGAIVAAIRPEKIALRAAAAGECGTKGEVISISYRGGETLITLRTEKGATLTTTITNKSRTQSPPTTGNPQPISWSPKDMIVLAD